MGDTDDLFVSEAISKPENRVNLALLSLMQQDWFREWILKRLCLPADAVVYPPTNVGTRRPDFKGSSSTDCAKWVAPCSVTHLLG